MSVPPRRLDVLLRDRLVGSVTHLGADRTIFTFDEAYADDPNRPTLSLAFRDDAGGLMRTGRSVQTRLDPFFSNLLPEGYLRTYLARLAGVKPVREYSLLAALGEDLPGAVVVCPAFDAGVAELGSGEARRDADGGPLRFSLAGVQLKFSAIDRTRGGLTIPASGAGGSWIVKLPSARFAGLAANEFSMLTLARRVGIDVPEIRLVAPGRIAGLPAGVERLREEAFAIRRFDRGADGARVHTEDFAQVFGVYPEAKYERGSYRAIAAVVWREAGAADTAEFVRRLVFCALIGNGDMHLKNWSLIYPDGLGARLTPAYDFVSTVAYLPGDDAALKYDRTRKAAELTLGELGRMAERAGFPRELALETARETVARFRDAWREEKTRLPMRDDVRAAIEAHLPRLPIAAID